MGLGFFLQLQNSAGEQKPRLIGRVQCRKGKQNGQQEIEKNCEKSGESKSAEEGFKTPGAEEPEESHRDIRSEEGQDQQVDQKHRVEI